MPLSRVATPRRLAALLVAPLLLLPLVMAVPAAAVPGSGSSVWINEIHYDNTGADTGEAIEIAAPAGSDLSNWSLVLYNGNGGAPYDTLALPSVVPDTTDGWGLVTVPATGLQNGSPDGVALVRDAALVQFLSYEGSFTAVGGPADRATSTDIGVSEASSPPVGQSLQLTGGPGTDPDGFDWIGPDDASFSAANEGQTFGTAPPAVFPPPVTCDEGDVVKISAVQGSGPASPKRDTTVLVEAVATAERPGLGGFFLQEEDDQQDGNTLTSEGVFVFGSLPSGASVGDVVRVRGVVEEDFGQTRIKASSGRVCSTSPVPTATEVTFPLASTTFLERYEGMLVTFPQDLVISEYFNYDRFGETLVGLPLPGTDRFFTPTAVVEPGSAANALAAQYPLRRITVDDGRSSQNPSPAYFPGTVDTPFTLDNRFRGGDTLTDVTGVLAFAFGLYRVHPTADAQYTSENPRPEQPPAVGGDVKVASFNVLNYFLTLDDGTNDVCGANQDLECRGADDAEELQRQRAKILDAITRLDADVVGLIEMENTPGVEPAADLVAGLNDLVGAGTYDFIDTGVIGTDAIRVGFLYQPASVMPLGTHHILDSSVDPTFLDEKNRPALAQTFKQVRGDNRFTVAVNHFKSKGSDCNDVGDPDLGDGQGNCNVTRTAAATALTDWLQQPQLGKGDPDRLIIGDLNAYDHEDPIDALKAAGYRDLVEKFGGEFAYGFVFDGQVGYLDHALANTSMKGQVTGAAEWHINADEPDILDYDTTFKRDAEDTLYEPNAFRSSDHDAVLVGLDLTGHSRNR